ncbi:MAG: proton-conducting transporter membrane subunit, partial [Myxococcales bacterium]|nr:proton-conducting transporter membrane subunit [Myxococcales bacterium]
MMTLDEIQLAPLALDLLLAAGLLFVFLADLILGPRQGKSLGYLSAFILLTILVASFWLDTHGLAFGGAYIGGPWPLFFKRVFLAAGVLVCLGSADHIAARQPNRQGEYYLLLLSSLLGMMLLPGARDLLLLFVCFELMGIPLYVLAAYPKTDDPSGRERGAVEGAMKLYLIGAASTAITLFGLSWVVGLAGTTAIAGIAALPSSPLLALGMAMIIAGMGFKIGVAPFHMWVPDTYEGGSTPFIA